MDEQEQNDILKKFKIKMRLGLSLIVIAGLFISIYFIFFNPIERDKISTITEESTLSSILVSNSISGGLCMDGNIGQGYGCNTTLTIDINGNYDFSSKRFEKNVILSKGKLTNMELNELKELIENTDFDEIKKHQFTETCPTAYDESEGIYNFYLSEDVIERISSCQYIIDSDSPVFDEISRIFREYSK